jgi:hypothetical protein
MIHQCRARWIVGNCPVWLVRASHHSTLFELDSILGRGCLVWLLHHLMPFLTTLSIVPSVLLYYSPIPLCRILRRNVATPTSSVSFCRTTFEFIFFSTSLHPSPPCVSRLVSCLSSMDPRAITIPLCTKPLLLRFFISFLLFIFDLKLLLPLHRHHHHHHHYGYDYYRMLFSLFFYIVTVVVAVAVIQHIGQT